MTFDPDNVRVDLLKVKRKIYISYPEGSKEREDFLFASKLSELGYLTKLVDPVLVSDVYADYNDRLTSEVFTIVSCLGVGLGISIAMLGFHQSHPHSEWLSLYILPFLFGVGFAGTHVSHLVKNWKDFQPFRKECETLRKRIEKLTKEIKGLAK
jgi:hypothetical protein